MVQVVVVGGGIGGLAVAVFLGRRGHRVTVLEKDSRGPGTDLESDFFDWHRPQVPQAMQPHNLHAPVRTVLRSEAPDVYASMLRFGAEEWHEFHRMSRSTPPGPGDADLISIRARRILLERALSDAARDQPEVVIHQGDPATALISETRAGHHHILGVHSTTGPHPADLVIDAAGRRSPIPAWLTHHGGRSPVIDTHQTGIAYFCRWYRLRPDAARTPATSITGGSTRFALGGVFPSDNGVFAISLVVSTTDPTRTALRDPQIFEAIARTYPGCAEWLALPHDAVGPVRAMAGLHNRSTSLIDTNGPIVTGLLGIGDTVMHTNPTLGLGIPFALRMSAWLAANAHRPPDADLVVDQHHWIATTLTPWFDHQVTSDREAETHLRQGWQSTPADTHPSPANTPTPLRTALPWCALDDPHVMRARAQVRNLMALPDTAYTTPDIERRVTEWLNDHPTFTPPPQGPSREAWEQITARTIQTTAPPTH